MNLLEVFLAIQNLVGQKGPAYPTNLLSVAVDNHSNPDPEGRVLIRFTTLDEHEHLARIAILEDLTPEPPPPGESVKTGGVVIEPQTDAEPTPSPGLATPLITVSQPAPAPTPAKAVLPPRTGKRMPAPSNTTAPVQGGPIKW